MTWKVVSPMKPPHFIVQGNYMVLLILRFSQSASFKCRNQEMQMWVTKKVLE